MKRPVATFKEKWEEDGGMHSGMSEYTILEHGRTLPSSLIFVL